MPRSLTCAPRIRSRNSDMIVGLMKGLRALLFFVSQSDFFRALPRVPPHAITNRRRAAALRGLTVVPEGSFLIYCAINHALCLQQALLPATRRWPDHAVAFMGPSMAALDRVSL